MPNAVVLSVGIVLYVELRKRFRFRGCYIFQIVDNLNPDLEYSTDMNMALLSTQAHLALRYFASGCYQTLSSDVLNGHQTTACRAIRRMSLYSIRKEVETACFLTKQREIRHCHKRKKLRFKEFYVYATGTHLYKL